MSKDYDKEAERILIQDNYNQGFLTEAEYEFQLKCNEKGVVLHIVPKGTYSDEDIYTYSVSISKFISSQFQKEEPGERTNFEWLKPSATRPSFNHLCFCYKSVIYSCLIGIVMNNDEVWVNLKDWENFKQKTEKYNLFPCIIPITLSGEFYDEKFWILDAEYMNPINFDYPSDTYLEWKGSYFEFLQDL